MSKPAECSECLAIVEELQATGRERASRLSAERREELRTQFDALRKMMAGSEEGVDELLVKFPFRSRRPERLRMPEYGPSDPRIEAVARKMFEHETRTGHRIVDLFRK